jgi:DNA-binding NtrC family response regulator
VFLAEDDVEMRRMLADTLRRDGHLVLEQANGSALLSDLVGIFESQGACGVSSVVVTDLRMPGGDGLSLLRAVAQHAWCPPVILITAYGDAKVHEEARRLGAAAILDKPFDLSELRLVISRAVHPALSRDA